jgi:hypothetical protein
MKTKIGFLVLAFTSSFMNLNAQYRTVTTARATSYDISDNLDLDAVASIFGDSENLEDFERRLNDPKNRISNLDLNEDGYIDYLRVVENSSDQNSLVVVQAVLDKDVYQDVATIEVQRQQGNNHRIQIVGDPYIYGSNYIIEPVFVRTPLIFSFFWGPRYHYYQSPYYWNYYPGWYSYYRPYSPFKYHRHITVHINHHNTYHRTSNRNIHFSGDKYNQIRRNDYASKHPDRSFENRNEGLRNKQDLNEHRPNNQVNRQRNYEVKQPDSRQNQDSRNSNSIDRPRQREGNENKRPDVIEKSAQKPIRSFDIETKNDRPSNQDRQLEKKNESRNDSYDRSRTPEKRSETRTEQPSSRVSTPQKNVVPAKSSSVTSERRSSNTNTKQKSESSKKAEVQKSSEKKESENSRRR